jgi:hypothetical protein
VWREDPPAATGTATLRAHGSSPRRGHSTRVFRIPTVGSWAVNSFALVDDDDSVTLVDTGLDSAPGRIVAGPPVAPHGPARFEAHVSAVRATVTCC